MTKISNNLEWRNRKICHLILIIREREVLNTKLCEPNKRKTFHYASHAWSQLKGRRSLIARNQIHHLQKQIKKPTCSRQYTENEIKAVRIHFFWGIYRLYRISEFVFVCVTVRRKGKDHWEVETSFSYIVIQEACHYQKQEHYLNDLLKSNGTLWRCPK